MIPSTQLRLRLILTFVIVISLALCSYWLMKQTNKNLILQSAPSSRIAPDFYITQFKFTRLIPNGKTKYYMTGNNLKHLPQDDHFEIDNPYIVSFNPNTTPTTISAKKSLIENKKDHIHLYQNVKLQRPSSPTNGAIQLQTDYLLYLAIPNILKTHLPSRITIKDAQFSANQLEINNLSRHITLNGNVKTQLTPRQ
jgi:lipopolysaccharide export system protein LptC